VLRRFNECPCWETLHALWAFPKCVLASGARTGAAHWAALGRRIKSRALSYLARPVGESWEDTHRPVIAEDPQPGPSTRGKVALDEARRKEAWASRITTLVGRKAISKACRQLTSEGIQRASDPDVLQRLRDLHPVEAPPVDMAPLMQTESLPFDNSLEGDRDRLSALRKAINGFSPDSAPGPSGLRPDHLKDMVGDGAETDSTGLLKELDTFIQRALNDPWPGPAALVLCAATLTPLVKSDPNGGPDGTRPIAAGETLRRLVGRVLMRVPCVSRYLRALAPSQCGVGVSGACTLIAMGLQQYVNHLQLHGTNRGWLCSWIFGMHSIRSAGKHSSARYLGVARRCLRGCGSATHITHPLYVGRP